MRSNSRRIKASQSSNDYESLADEPSSETTPQTPQQTVSQTTSRRRNVKHESQNVKPQNAERSRPSVERVVEREPLPTAAKPTFDEQQFINDFVTDANRVGELSRHFEYYLKKPLQLGQREDFQNEKFVKKLFKEFPLNMPQTTVLPESARNKFVSDLCLKAQRAIKPERKPKAPTNQRVTREHTKETVKPIIHHFTTSPDYVTTTDNVTYNTVVREDDEEYDPSFAESLQEVTIAPNWFDGVARYMSAYYGVNLSGRTPDVFDENMKYDDCIKYFVSKMREWQSSYEQVIRQYPTIGIRKDGGLSTKDGTKVVSMSEDEPLRVIYDQLTKVMETVNKFITKLKPNTNIPHPLKPLTFTDWLQSGILDTPFVFSDSIVKKSLEKNMNCPITDKHSGVKVGLKFTGPINVKRWQQRGIYASEYNMLFEHVREFTLDKSLSKLIGKLYPHRNVVTAILSDEQRRSMWNHALVNIQMLSAGFDSQSENDEAKHLADVLGAWSAVLNSPYAYTILMDAAEGSTMFNKHILSLATDPFSIKLFTTSLYPISCVFLPTGIVDSETSFEPRGRASIIKMQNLMDSLDLLIRKFCIKPQNVNDKQWLKAFVSSDVTPHGMLTALDLYSQLIGVYVKHNAPTPKGSTKQVESKILDEEPADEEVSDDDA